MVNQGLILLDRLSEMTGNPRRIRLSRRLREQATLLKNAVQPQVASG